jgi:predicted DNA-binding transcriptional regulator AlpA
MEKFVTFAELSEMLGISPSRLYDLIRDGIFPEPLRNPKNQRPYFSSELTEACKQVVRSRVGLNGLPYTPNRKRKKDGRSNLRSKHDALIVSLAGLGLNATAKQIDDAVKSLPEGLEEGELVKQVFLRLRNQP